MASRRYTLSELRAHYDYRARAVDVTGDPAIVAQSDARRVYLLLVDQGGAGDIRAAPGKQATAAEGLPVGTLGTGAVEVWTPRHGVIPQLPWLAASAGGVGTVYVVEVFWMD